MLYDFQLLSTLRYVIGFGIGVKFDFTKIDVLW